MGEKRCGLGEIKKKREDGVEEERVLMEQMIMADAFDYR